MSFSNIFHRRNSQDHEDQGQPTSLDPYKRPAEHFTAYLRDAKASVKLRLDGSSCWVYAYDGLDPPSHALAAASNGNCNDKSFETDNQLSVTVSSSSDAASSALHNNNLDCSDVAAESSGYTSLNAAPLSASPSESGPLSMTAEEDREFWSLMKDPTVSEVKLNRVIQRMQQQDELSYSSSLNGSNAGSDHSPRDAGKLAPPRQDVDLSINSLGKC